MGIYSAIIIWIITIDLVHADDSLNLDSLLIQIKPEVTSKWHPFGQALGVDNKLLDTYLPYPPEQNIIEVCDNWLRNHTGKPTWKEVAEALKRISFQQLAFDIEKVYETGEHLLAVHAMPCRIKIHATPLIISMLQVTI